MITTLNTKYKHTQLSRDLNFNFFHCRSLIPSIRPNFIYHFSLNQPPSMTIKFKNVTNKIYVHNITFLYGIYVIQYIYILTIK